MRQEAERDSAYESKREQSISDGTRHVAGAALAGIVGLIEGNVRHRELLLQWLQQQASQRAHLHDVHAQSDVSRALFGARARELTLRLASHWTDRDRPRAQVRERLAAEIVTAALHSLAAMREGGHSAVQVQRQLQVQLDALGNLGDIPGCATAYVATRMRLPEGFTGAEWASLQEGPILAVLHLSAAASNGPRELLREFRQADCVILDLALERTQDTVLGAVFHAGMSPHRLKQLADRYPSRRTLLGQLQNCLAISEKFGTPARREYGALVTAAAQEAADAARERDRFGRRGMLEAERRALHDIERLVAH